MRVERLGPSTFSEWDAFVNRHRDSTAYHLRAWAAAGTAAYALDALWLLARDAPGQPVRGVLPLFVVRNALARYATTGLFGAYGSVLAEDSATRGALLAEAQRIADERRLRYFVHKSLGGEPPPPGFRSTGSQYVTAMLPLTGNDESQWLAFRSEIRNRVRKARRSGLAARVGVDQLEHFYRVLAVNMHRKGTPIYGLRFLRTLVDALGERAEVLTLWHDGDCTSGALVVFHNGVVTVPFVSSLPSTFHLGSNNLLYWEIISRANARGAHTLDFGRSFEGSSNLTFKLRWGAHTVSQPWYFYSSNGARPHTDAADATVRLLVHLWRRLPLAVANAVGPAICGWVLV